MNIKSNLSYVTFQGNSEIWSHKTGGDIIIFDNRYYSYLIIDIIIFDNRYYSYLIIDIIILIIISIIKYYNIYYQAL
jgi:hypothetical protein